MWVASPHLALASERDGSLTGYAVARKCIEGWKIGPLFADSTQDAENLFAAVSTELSDSEIFIDVPEPRTAFAEFLARSGLDVSFETARMYKGTPLPLSAKVFGVTTLELG